MIPLRSNLATKLSIAFFALPTLVSLSLPTADCMVEIIIGTRANSPTIVASSSSFLRIIGARLLVPSKVIAVLFGSSVPILL